MKLPLLVLSLAVPLLLPRAAFAQENVHVRYQNALLARTLAPADKSYCVAKVGERSSDNAGLYDQCQVTRLFVADLKVKKAEGFPPMTEIKFTRGAEFQMVSDAMP